MVVMQVDPNGQQDPKLRELANAARHALDDLVGYVDVIPPKMILARIQTLKSASSALKEYDCD